MVRVASEPSQIDCREVSSPSSKQFMAEGSMENRKGKILDRGDAPSITLPPEAFVSVNLESKNAGNEDMWIGNACPVVEEPLNEDLAI